MKKFFSVILAFTVAFSTLSLSFVQTDTVLAAENNGQFKTIENIEKNSASLSSPLTKEIAKEDDGEVSPLFLPVWAAWALVTVGGALLAEVTFDVYSHAKEYVINRTTAANTNMTNSTYDVKMFGDRFTATLSSNKVGNGMANNKLRVITLQKALNARGYNTTVDGYWGANTRNQVINFQAAKRISADGIVGPSTWYALQRK